ncbi:MAG: sulfotransferase, partial [Marinirhabdus sp.]
MMEQPVNLFVVGAMKAGTTGFVNVLSRHPDIYVPPIKEPNYFSGNLPRTLYTPSPFFNLGTYFKSRFPQPLHIAKLETGAQHKKLYSLQPETVTYAVDASTSYLHNPVAAKNIYGYNAQAKIIVLTRDPLQRAHSHYLMNRGLGREARSFENVMRAEIAQYKNNTLPWHSCLAMSFYGEAVRRYVSVFGENVKVYIIYAGPSSPS